MMKIFKQNGFGLLELLVSISLFAVAVLAMGYLYSISQRSYNQAESRNDLTQNARVALERMTTELRQAEEIETVLGGTEETGSSEIFFQGGHDNSRITYIRYYLEGSSLKRSETAYYLPGSPEVFVDYQTLDGLGNPAQQLVLSDSELAEYVQNIKFWGTGLINIKISLEAGNETFVLETAVASRND